MEWQPIETAPKDGTRIILFGGEYWCDWQREVKGPAIAAWINSPDRPDKWDKCWTVAAAESGYEGAFYDNPTHWLPLDALPPPPTDIEQTA